MYYHIHFDFHHTVRLYFRSKHSWIRLSLEEIALILAKFVRLWFNVKDSIFGGEICKIVLTLGKRQS